MTTTDPFDTEFWPYYLRPVKKIAARDALRWALHHHNPDGQLMTQIRAALIRQAIEQPDGRFWTTPEKWIYGLRWTDEPIRKPDTRTPEQRARDERHAAAVSQQMEFAKRRHREEAS